jgi:hypothetical protein
MKTIRLLVAGLVLAMTSACLAPFQLMTSTPIGSRPARVSTELSALSRVPTVTQPPTVVSAAPTLTVLPPSPSPTATAQTTATSTPVWQTCQRPPNDYTHVEVNGHTVNARTRWMLQLAAALYHGRGDPLRVTQGSYVDDLAASFGTHAGGGAVDISVKVKDGSEILNDDELEELVHALRAAGFAAWARLPDDLNPPVPIHIHAIAIGDRELSEAARRQIDGPEGYLRGLDGVPPEFGGPKSDRYGGPVTCRWMIESGFNDLRMLPP